jgi:hypothetical protein
MGNEMGKGMGFVARGPGEISSWRMCCRNVSWSKYCCCHHAYYSACCTMYRFLIGVFGGRSGELLDGLTRSSGSSINISYMQTFPNTIRTLNT